jgi:hypothetical protein
MGKPFEGELGHPLGCKIKGGQLDDGFLNLFKNNNLVVVEHTKNCNQKIVE